MAGSESHSKRVVEPGLEPVWEPGNWSPRGRWLPSWLESLHYFVSSSLTELLLVFNPSVHTPTCAHPPQSPAPSAATFLILPCGYIACPCTQSRLSHPGTISHQYFLSRGLLASTLFVRVVCTSSSLLVFHHSMKFDPLQNHNQLLTP